MNNNPKYSILIPTRNSLEYVKDCVTSVLQQNYTDFECIVSDNYSDDGTYDYFKSMDHSNLILTKPPESMAMTDHWEWVLSKARGDWITFVGSDDGLQPYFFELADCLIKIATKRKIHVINSVRPQFVWDSKDFAFKYYARAGYQIKSTKWGLLNSTVGCSNYVEVPMMYSGSIINKSIIQKGKVYNGGKFFNTSAPDADAAAIICLIEEKHLESLIPLAWWGSSPKSNGRRYTENRDRYIIQEKREINRAMSGCLLPTFQKSDSGTTPFPSIFKICLADSLFKTKYLQSSFWKRVYDSKLFKTMLISNIFYECKIQQYDTSVCKEFAAITNISFRMVRLFSKIITPNFRRCIRIIMKLGKVKFIFSKHISSEIRHPSNSPLSLMDANSFINKLVKENNFIDNFILQEEGTANTSQ